MALLNDRINALTGGIGGALASADYRLYWFGQFSSTTGRWMYRTGLFWVAWKLTESEVWLGVLAFADTFPLVVFAIAGGVMGDRLGYVKMILVSQIAMTGNAVVLVILIAFNAISIEWLVALATLWGICDAISNPARLAIVYSLVDKVNLPSAIALSSATFNASRLLGPAMAGPLLLKFDAWVVMAVAAGFTLYFLLVMLRLQKTEIKPDRQARTHWFRDLRDGLVFAFGHSGIRFLFFVLAVAGLFVRPYLEFLPAFSDEVFDREADGFALLLSSTGFGALIGGLWLARRGTSSGLTRYVTGGLLVSAIAALSFTATDLIWVAVVCAAVLGGSLVTAAIASQSLIQMMVAQSLRAKLMSLFIAISWGTPAIGALAAGPIIELVGLRATIAAGGVVALGAWLFAAKAGRRIAAEIEK